MKTTDLIPLILHQLVDEDKYGYDIVKQIEEDSNGIINIKQPTLYSLLKKLEQNRFITSYWKDSEIGGKRHYYQITANGKSQIETYPAYSKLIQDCCAEEMSSPTLFNTNKEDFNTEHHIIAGNTNQNFSATQDNTEKSSSADGIDGTIQIKNSLETPVASDFSNISAEEDNYTVKGVAENRVNYQDTVNINRYTNASIDGNLNKNQNSYTEYENIYQRTENIEENINNCSKPDDVLENISNVAENSNQNRDNEFSRFASTLNLSNNTLNQDFKDDIPSPIETQTANSEEIKITPINLVKDEPLTEFKFGNTNTDENTLFKTSNESSDISFNSSTYNSIENSNKSNEYDLKDIGENCEQVIDISQNTAYKDNFSKDDTLPEPQKSVNIFDIIEPVECNTKPTLNKGEIDNSAKISSSNSSSNFASSNQIIDTSSPINKRNEDNLNKANIEDDNNSITSNTFVNKVKINEDTSYNSNIKFNDITSNIKTSSNECSTNKDLSDLTKNGLNSKLEEQVTNFTIEQQTDLNQVEVIDHDSVPYAKYVNLKTDISAIKRRKTIKLHTVKMISTCFVLMIMLAISMVIAIKTSFTRLYCICLVVVGLIIIFYPLLYAKNKTKMRLKYCTRPFVYNITMDFFVKLSIFLILFTLIFAYNIKICNEFKDIFTFANASNFISPLIFSFALLIDFCFSALFFKRFIVRNRK